MSIIQKVIDDPEKINELINYENEMIRKCEELIARYAGFFALYGCELKLEYPWDEESKEMMNWEREPFIKGYDFSVVGTVTRNGESFRYKDIKGKQDYCEIGNCWLFDEIIRKGFKLCICYYSDEIDEMEQDILSFKEELENAIREGLEIF